MLGKSMAAAQGAVLVLKAPWSLSTLATVSVYQAAPERQEAAASCRGELAGGSPAPAGYKPVPAETARSSTFLHALGSLELCGGACVILPAGALVAATLLSALSAGS